MGRDQTSRAGARWLTFASGNSRTAPTIRARSPHSGARARMQRRGDRARSSFGCWTGLPATGPAGLRTWTARPTVRVRRNATAQARFRSGRRSAAHRRMVTTQLPKAHPAFIRKGMKGRDIQRQRHPGADATPSRLAAAAPCATACQRWWSSSSQRTRTPCSALHREPHAASDPLPGGWPAAEEACKLMMGAIALTPDACFRR